MVGRNVQQYGDVCPELVHVVELETAKLDDVVVVVPPLGNLQGEAPAYVACQPYVVACIPEDVVDEACRGGLAV